MADKRFSTPTCWLVALAVVALLALAGGRSDAAQDGETGRRVALVVGNDTYLSQSVLRNAVNDARAVEASLKDAGFSVRLLEDAGRAQLTSALGEFADSLGTDDIALFFFAGHGVQVDATNYLLPTDYAGRGEADVKLNALSVVTVQEMLQPARVAMLVLDACRNNPYRGVRGGGTGLAPMEARGTLIAYSAGADQLADDAPNAANGLFTGKLVEALEEPGLTAAELFRRVRREVYTESNGDQWPAVYDDLLSDFVFRPGAPDDAAVAAELLQQETTFWTSIVESTNPEDFRAYLAQYPNGAYVVLARHRAVALEQEAIFWTEIVESTNPEDFRAYLAQYPRGAYAALARNREAALREAASAQRPVSPSLSVSRPEVTTPSSAPAVAAAAPSISRPEVTRPSNAPAAAATALPGEQVSQGTRRLSARLGRELSARRSDENGWTDLHYAAALNLPGVVDYLSRAGAATDATLSADGNRLSDGLRRTLSGLGQNLDDWTRDGETPLHVAAFVGAADAVRRLLARGADPDARTVLNWMPLHYAAWSDAREVVENLLARGVDVNARVVGDWTPLHVAAWADSHEAAAALLAGGADAAAENEDGDTPLELSQSTRMRTLLSRWRRR